MPIVFDRENDLIKKTVNKLNEVRQWIFVHNIGHVAGSEYGVSFIQKEECRPYLYIEMVTPNNIHNICSFLNTEDGFFLDTPENHFTTVTELKQLIENQIKK